MEIILDSLYTKNNKCKGILGEEMRKVFQKWLDEEFTEKEQEELYMKEIAYMKEAFKAGCNKGWG